LRRALRILLAAGIGLSLSCAGGRPNILLIVIDTARADRFSIYGAPSDSTPAVAALAAEGAVYEHAVTPAPWTVPAHASLFTGLFPSAHGADSGHLRLDDEFTTLAESLRDAGYHTLGYTGNPWIGKLHNFDQGFDEYEETWRDFHDTEGDMGAAVFTGRVERFLEGRRASPLTRGRPFFIFINYFEPHLPYDPPEPERERFLKPPVDREAVERLRHLKHPQEMPYLLGLQKMPPDDLRILGALYTAEIAYVDRNLGELLGLLRREGELDRTVVVITSDHGEMLGEHGFLDHKLNVYEPLLHVPLVIRYPPAVPTPRRIAEPVYLQDLHPTLLALAGVPAPRPAMDDTRRAAGWPRDAVLLPGLDTLRGGRSTGDEPLVAECATPIQFLGVIRKAYPDAAITPWDRTLIAWREGNDKLHWSSDGHQRLYDLGGDPGEDNDLAGQRPERVRDMAARVKAWLNRPGARPPVSPSGTVPPAAH